MPRKKQKTRRLWLNVTQKGVNVSRRKFVQRLIDSIEDGTYKLPKEWKVVLHWRNRENARMKRGEWQEEMEQSAQSSPGWDIAVLTYLRRKLR